MPVYSNPANMFGNNSNMIPGNPLAGALAGISGAYGMASADQGLEEGRLGLMAKLHEYEQSKLDDPMMAAKREAGIAEAGTTSQYNQSGDALKAKQAAMEQVIAQTKATELSSQDKAKTLKQDYLVDLASRLDDAPDPMTAAGREWMAHEKQAAAAVGVPLPDMLTKEHKASIKAHAAAWVNNAESQRKQADRAAQEEAATKRALAVETLRGQNQELVHTGDRASKEEVANIRAQGIKDVQGLRNEHANAAKKYEAQIIENVTTMITKDMKDGKLSPETRKAAAAAASLMADNALKDDNQYQLLKLQAGKPEIDVQMKQMKQRVMSDYLDTIPGYKAAEGRSAGKVVQEGAPAGSEDKAAKILQKLKANPNNNGKSDKEMLDAAKAAGYLN